MDIPDLSFSRLRSRASAGDLRRTAGAIDAADRPAVRCGIACNVKIYGFACFRRQLRILDQRKPCNPVERRFGFVPFHARVLDPEIGVASLAPIGHLASIEKLNGKVEPAQLAILLDVPCQFVLQALGVALLQRTRRIVRRR